MGLSQQNRTLKLKSSHRRDRPTETKPVPAGSAQKRQKSSKNEISNQTEQKLNFGAKKA